MSTSNRFIKKLPQHKRKNELFVLVIIAILMFSAIFLYTYIINLPIITSKYPRINIICNEDPNINNYVDSTFELESEDSKDTIRPIKSKIITRGSSPGKGADRWPKKSYRIQLSQQKSLLGMRKDDDWLLFAMYMDFPRMRVKMAFELYRSLESTNPTAILPESQYILLYLNGEFQGLYLLAEKNDRRLFGLDDAQNNINSSFIFQIKHYNNLKEYQKERFEQDWPNEDEDIFIMDQIMTELVSFISNTSDSEFFDPNTGVYSVFDKQNLIDFYIYNFFIFHDDFWHKNYFIARNTYPNKIFLITWDFDQSFGQHGWSRRDADHNPEFLIRESNYLYNRLINNTDFMRDCKNRWIYLREKLWTEEFILEMLSDIYKEIEDILEIDTSKWNPIWIYEKWDNQVEIFIEHLFQWIPDRLEFCDDYFDIF